MMNRRKRTSRFNDNQNLNQVEKIEVQLFKTINDIEVNVDQMITMIEKMCFISNFPTFWKSKQSIIFNWS